MSIKMKVFALVLTARAYNRFWLIPMIVSRPLVGR
jgi:hypothetical protein